MRPRLALLALIVALTLALTTACSRHPLKHTQRATFSVRFSVPCFWFTRPNNEFFEMCFDNPPPLVPGMQFQDISYTDDNADLRHFVKAQFVPSPAPSKR